MSIPTAKPSTRLAWCLVAPYVALLLGLIVLPLLAALHKSFSAVPTLSFTLLSAPLRALSEPLTLDHYQFILGSAQGWRVILTTVVVAAVVATLLCVLSMFVAYGLARGGRGKAVVNAVITFPSIAPGVTIIFGVLWLFGPMGPVNEVLWRQLGIVAEPIVFTGTMAAVIVGDMLLFSTIAMRIVASVYESIPLELELASQSLGASMLQTFSWVLWPLLMPGLAAAWIFLFFRTMAAYVAALLLGGGTQGVVVIPLEIYMQVNSLGVGGTVAQAAALACVLLMATLIGRVLFLWIMRRNFSERLGSEVL